MGEELKGILMLSYSTSHCVGTAADPSTPTTEQEDLCMDFSVVMVLVVYAHTQMNAACSPRCLEAIQLLLGQAQRH